jgi:type I restriction enzyme, S subunit
MNRVSKSGTSMKESRVPWIGKIPATWETRALGSLCSKITNGYVGPTRDILVETGVTYLQSLHIKNNHIRFDGRYFVTSEWSQRHSKSILRAGDVLIVQTGDIGQVAVVPREYEGANCHALIVVSCTEAVMSGHFLAWVLNSNYGLHSLRSIQTGALHPHLNCGNVKFLQIPVPPRAEQDRISDFLNHATAKIDGLIERQEELIQRIEEKHRAVITHVVTKGLNSDVPTKDSGTPWIGEIPAHWTAIKLSFVSTKIGSGKTPTGGAESYVEDGVVFIRSQNVRNEGLSRRDLVYITNQVDAEMSSTRVRGGDVLLNITGASIGRICVAPDDLGPANLNQHVCIIRVRPNLMCPEYLWRLGVSDVIQSQVASNEQGISREGLNFEQVANLLIPRPPLEEQQVIAKYVERAVSKLRIIREKCEQAISLLKEHRSALITAAVTGQIDVANRIAEAAE